MAVELMENLGFRYSGAYHLNDRELAVEGRRISHSSPLLESTQESFFADQK